MEESTKQKEVYIKYLFLKLGMSSFEAAKYETKIGTPLGPSTKEKEQETKVLLY